MIAKNILFICVQVILVKEIFGQCIPGGPYIDDYASRLGLGAASFGYGPYDSITCPGAVVSTNGGVFAVTSSSPISPTGITVLSENSIDGVLTVIGELPFLGAVALDGSLPTVGAGGINYGCGNGNVAIISEGLSPVAPAVGPAYPAGYGYGPGLLGPGIGYGPGLAGGIGYGPDMTGFGYGCGGFY